MSDESKKAYIEKLEAKLKEWTLYDYQVNVCF
jgi:hypothetical protein